MKKVFIIATRLVVALIMVMSILLGYLGMSSPLLMVTFYILIALGINWTIKWRVTSLEQKTNYKILLVATICSLICAELSLKYVFKTHISYSEHDEGFFYSSPFRIVKIESLAKRLLAGQKNMHLRNYSHSRIEIVERHEFSYANSFNSLGFRGREPSGDTSNYTIVGLGDSFTEGVGAPGDSTWLVLLESKLNSMRSFPIKIECINGGLSGSDPFFEYVILKDVLLQYQPEMVIVSINESDISDIVTRGGNERFLPNGDLEYRSSPWWEYFYQFSFITRIIVHDVFDINEYLMTDHDLAEQKAAALFKIKNLLIRDFAVLSKQHNFKLVLILHPQMDELLSRNFSLQSLDDDFKDNSEITLINLYEYFRRGCEDEESRIRKLYWPMDRHNNSTGYLLWANILSEKLDSEI